MRGAFVVALLALAGLLAFASTAGARRRERPLAATREPVRVQLSATATRWLTTPFVVSGGERVHIHARGWWKVSDFAEQIDGDGAEKGSLDASQAAYAGYRVGALLCRVAGGEDDPDPALGLPSTRGALHAGKDMVFTADRAGPIECRINDAKVDDNAGELEVEISRAPAPPPDF
jgi:hypothetical protein